MKPDNDTFFNIIRYTPLISIDLILTNTDGKVLLGWRNNAPAKNTWFVPGGRILKDETLEEAFRRISLMETGSEISFQKAEFLGVYEHLYPGENYFEKEGVSTHYIVLGFRIKADIQGQLPKAQHHEYKWLSPEEIIKDGMVHQNVKNYFLENRGIKSGGIV